MIKKKGFTLIELLVVIAIIALLLSITMPALNKVKRQSRKLLCMTNHKQISIGLLAYAVNNNERFPEHPGFDAGNGAPYFYVGNKNNLAKDILSYVGDAPNIFICPVAPAGVEPPNPNLVAPQTARWNFYYMANYENKTLNYKSPVTRSTTAGTNSLWSEHTADVGPNWGNIRVSHAKGSAERFPNEAGDYGPSYLQWSVQDEEQVDDVTCVYVDGSVERLELEDLYYVKTSYGGNWYPPVAGYRANNVRLD